MNWRDFPPLSALRAFAATAEHGSFSGAARALNVTHAAVVQQVRALEARLSLPLVQREGRGLRLTQEGALLAEALTEGFTRIAAALSALQSESAARPLRVTLTASFATQWLMPRLKRFWDKHPEIALTLLPESQVIDLRAQRMDLGIRYGTGDWPGMEARYLAPADLMIAGAPALTKGRRLSPAEMAAMDWVLLSDWPEQDEYLRQLGLNRLKLPRTEFPSEDLSIAAARQGLGLIVDHRVLLEEDLAAGRLTLVQESPGQGAAYYIVTPPGVMRPDLRRFVTWLLSEAEEGAKKP